jgi:inner membrane protein
MPGAGLLLAAAAVSGIRQGRTLLLLLASYHLHLLCDVVGSRGPSARDIWSIDYLGPLSHAWNLSWSHQWPLNGWQNFVLSAFLILGCLVRTVRTGISPASLFSQRVDAIVVATLRRRWEQWSDSACP